jgi:chorismate mutase/prephenate dehydratase
LASLREHIDRIDDEILLLLNLRVQAVIEAGKLKQAGGRALYDPEREDEIAQRARQRNTGPLDDAAAERVFRRIITESRLVAETVVKSS